MSSGCLVSRPSAGSRRWCPNTPSWSEGRYLALVVLVAGVIHVATRSHSWIGTVLGIPPLVWIGRLSYGLYLFHLPIYSWLDEPRTGMTGWALFGVRMVVTTAVATASYFVIEQPIRRSGRVRLRVLFSGAAVMVGVVVATSVGLATPIGPPRSDVLAYALGTASASTPANVSRVLVVGGSAAWALGARQPSPYLRDGVQGMAVGAIGCGLTSRGRRCADVSGDVPVLHAAFRPRWLVLVPEVVDFTAFATPTTARAAERHLGQSLRGAGVGRGSRGSPSVRSPMTFRWISLVPAQIELAW